MESKMIKIYPRNNQSVPLKIIPGHFATNHSHINTYIDMTTLKTRQSDALAVAKMLVEQYVHTTIVDTIICLEGTQVIGAMLAEELTRAGFFSRNAHTSIYVVTPEQNSNTSQLIFRDNLKNMVTNRNIIILEPSITTGYTTLKVLEMVRYYGGILQGISAIFSVPDKIGGIPINALFSKKDLPSYQTYDYTECPFCKNGIPIDALVNGYGYSKL